MTVGNGYDGSVGQNMQTRIAAVAVGMGWMVIL